MDDQTSRPRPSWLTYRAAPYAWERMLLWALLVACFGVDLGARLVGGAVASMP